jgi:transposase InsO family protein
MEEHPVLSIQGLCQLLGVSRSWYYHRLGHAETIPAADIALRDSIEEIVLEFPGYGYRRVTHALARDGWTVNHKRVLRIMREESLLYQLKRRFVATTDSQHGFRRYPNLIKDLVIGRLDQVWVADLTYIRLPSTFCYLAAILDACSRRCVGWELSRCIDCSLTLAALERALWIRRPAAGLIHHSDQGVQYASHDYVERLEAAGIAISMAAKGNPFENAQAERFFRTLKEEEVYLNSYETFDEARANIGPFIEELYNTKRLHSSLGYVPPVEFEAAQLASRCTGGLQPMPME